MTELDIPLRSARAVGCLLVLVSLVPIALSTDTNIPIGQEAQAIDEHYNQLHSLEAQFTETYRGSGMERSESGTLWLKKPGKMRWEYRSPRAKLFVSDGKNAWFYVPGDKQARETPVRKLEDIRSPLAFLLGKTKLEKELQALSYAPDITPADPNDVVLRGVPRGMQDQISSVLLEINPEHQIVRIVMDGVDGATTEYRFDQIHENVQVADSRFRFAPPAGTETVEGDLGP